MFGKRTGKCKHLFRFFRAVVFEFHDTVIGIIVRTGNTSHFKIRTSYGIILFNGKRIATTQITRNKLIERTSDEVLIDFIKYLCRKLPQILLKIVLYQWLQTPVGIILPIYRNITLRITLYFVQLIIVVHIHATHRHIRQCCHEFIFQRCHSQIEQANGIKLLVKELFLIEFTRKVGNIVRQFIINYQRIQHCLCIIQ